jgi:cephalosporin hydroxylase
MKFCFDTDTGILTTQDSLTPAAPARQMPLYSREAFELLSREWVRCGWALHYYFTLTWFGRPILQLPEDLVRLQEVLVALQPDVIIETGICFGGSLLFHATICEALGKGRVIGVDLNIPEETRAAITAHRLAHHIRMIEGDAIAPATIEAVKRLVSPGETVLVILDSDHTKAHVASELDAYSGFVTPGSCIVAADGIMRDLTDVPGGDPAWAHDNPAAAAREFVDAHPEFEMRQPAWLFNHSTLEKSITYWPDGWLWRKS